MATKLHMCFRSYFIVLLSSVFFYNVQNSQNLENSINEQVCPNFWLALYITYNNIKTGNTLITYFTWFLCWLLTFYFFHRAHDSDVKEANKQKCQLQQPCLQPGKAVYPAQSQSVTVAQFVHRPTFQFAQQSCQPVLVSAHASSTYLCRSGPLQASSGPSHGQAQPQTVSVPIDAKMKMPNRSYQVYPCTAPCFNRWWQADRRG